MSEGDMDNTDIVPRHVRLLHRFTWHDKDARRYSCNGCGEFIDARDGKELRENAVAHFIGSMECAMGEGPVWKCHDCGTDDPSKFLYDSPNWCLKCRFSRM